MADTEKSKEAVVDCFPVVVTNDSVKTEKKMTTEKGQKTTRKRIVQVTCLFLFVIVLIVVAFLLILFLVPQRQELFNKQQKTYSVAGGDLTVKEETYIGDEDRLTQYYFKDDDEETWVILDLNRYIEIMKISKTSGFKACYVSPVVALNPKFTQNSTDTTNDTDTGSLGNARNQSSLVNFKRSVSPIRDTSILGPKGVALCKDSEVFWSLPWCFSEDSSKSQAPAAEVPDAGGGRSKRSYWYQWCYWDWNNCYYFSYPNEGYRVYYRCGILCTWIWL